MRSSSKPMLSTVTVQASQSFLYNATSCTWMAIDPAKNKINRYQYTNSNPIIYFISTQKVIGGNNDMYNRPLELLVEDFENMMKLYKNMMKLYKKVLIRYAQKTHRQLSDFGLKMSEAPYYFSLCIIVDPEGESQEFEVFELASRGVEDHIDALVSGINCNIQDHPEYLSTFKEKFKCECDKMSVKAMYAD